MFICYIVMCLYVSAIIMYLIMIRNNLKFQKTKIHIETNMFIYNNTYIYI